MFEDIRYINFYPTEMQKSEFCLPESRILYTCEFPTETQSRLVYSCEFCLEKEKVPHSLQRCGGCGKIRYCSRECQLKAWPLHKKVCDSFAKQPKEDREHKRQRLRLRNWWMREDLVVFKRKLMEKAKEGKAEGFGLCAVVKYEDIFPNETEDKGFNIEWLIRRNEHIRQCLSDSPTLPASFEEKEQTPFFIVCFYENGLADSLLDIVKWDVAEKKERTVVKRKKIKVVKKKNKAVKRNRRNRK